MSVRMRQFVERQIAAAFINAALSAGYTLSIDNGGDEDEEILGLKDLETTLKEMFATDDERLYVWKDGERIGWVRFIYGNDGPDVINDYTTNLDKAGPNGTSLLADCERLSEYWDNDGPFVPFTVNYLAFGVRFEDGVTNSIEVPTDDPKAAAKVLVESFGYDNPKYFDEIFIIKNDINCPSVTQHYNVERDY